jgi:hypothetical protein
MGWSRRRSAMATCFRVRTGQEYRNSQDSVDGLGGWTRARAGVRGCGGAGERGMRVQIGMEIEVVRAARAVWGDGMVGQWSRWAGAWGVATVGMAGVGGLGQQWAAWDVGTAWGRQRAGSEPICGENTDSWHVTPIQACAMCVAPGRDIRILAGSHRPRPPVLTQLESLNRL